MVAVSSESMLRIDTQVSTVVIVKAYKYRGRNRKGYKYRGCITNVVVQTTILCKRLYVVSVLISHAVWLQIKVGHVMHKRESNRCRGSRATNSYHCLFPQIMSNASLRWRYKLDLQSKLHNTIHLYSSPYLLQPPAKPFSTPELGVIDHLVSHTFGTALPSTNHLPLWWLCIPILGSQSGSLTTIF